MRQHRSRVDLAVPSAYALVRAATGMQDGLSTQMRSMAVSRLRMRTKLAFGVGAAAEQSVNVAFNAFNFLFYNNVLGLSGTLCGLAVTIAMVLDAIADPFVGFLSDRCRSKLGRRHPFMYAAPIPLAIAFYCIYVPPEGLAGVPLFLWFTGFTVLQRQAMTVYHVPHLALGAELSTDYHERSVVMSYNSIFAVVGGAAAFFFGWTWFASVPGGSGARAGYPGLAAFVAVFAAAMIFLSALGTRSEVARLARPPEDQPRFTLRALGRELGGCLRNRNYRMLLGGLVLLSATLGTRETLNAYVSLFYWGLPENKIRILGLATPPAFAVAFVFAVRLHGRYDKRNTLLGAVLVSVLASTLPVLLRLLGLFPANGSPALVPALFGFVFAFYCGIAVFTISVLSALADVADEHELDTGRRQEGVFYAARTLFAKLTSALGHVLAGLAVDLIGFPAGAKPGDVGDGVLLQLGVIDGLIATLPSVLALFFFARYRIDQRRHSEIQAALAKRAAPVAAAEHAVAPPAAAPPAA
jgi:Na+/melibiose symporter-like transporter